MIKLKAQDQLEYYEQGFGYNCSYEFPYLHTHDFWEFNFVQFDIEHFINGQNVIIHSNSITIIKPTDEHFIRAIESKHNIDKAPTHLNIKVTQAKLRELLDVIDTELYDLLENIAPITMQLNNDSSVDILKNFLSTLLWSTNVENNNIIIKTTIFLIINLFHQKIYTQSSLAIHHYPEIEEIISKINSRNFLACPIAEITNTSPYSYMQLTRLFRKVTGKTMQDYFLQVKMDYAIQQLRLTNRLIIDISNDIGVSSLSHFNHIFKQRLGITPGAYRKKNQQCFSANV